MKLYHFSEEDNIEIFRPRVKSNRRDMPPVVWAIDDEHAFTFYFPRNCPRIVYTKNENLTERDRERFFGTTNAEIVVTIETQWYTKIRDTVIYRYELPSDTFRLFDQPAGYYISLETVIPLERVAIDNGLERLMAMNIDVRFTPDLNPLREAILNSSIDDFGIHRFGYAKQKASS